MDQERRELAEKIIDLVHGYALRKVQAAINCDCGTDTASVKGPSTKPKATRRSRPKTEDEMRCRFTRNKKRCKNRSRGPRYRYLCTEHAKSR